MGIVTNKATPFIAPLLKKLGIEHYFSLVLGSDDVKALKPHPAPLYLTMGTFGLRKEELLLSAILVMILLQRKALNARVSV